MSTPSRREFFTYAAVATLASALPASAQTKKDQTKKVTKLLPLVVDVIGPMAFRWSGTKFELWMPDLTTKKNLGKAGVTQHQAGIMTTVTGSELNEAGDYQITGPSSWAGNPTVYSTNGGQVYEAKVNDTSARDRYIKMYLPMPHYIVVLHPVKASIYPTGSQQKTSGAFAVGVRLFYDQAGKPELVCPKGHSVIIPFDASPPETQTNMLIGYAPYDSRDDNHENARASFKEVSLLFPPLDLQVDFGPQAMSSGAFVHPDMGPFHDCKSPVIGLGGS